MTSGLYQTLVIFGRGQPSTASFFALGREIDLVEKEALRNPLRRHEILKTHKVVYAA